MTRIEVDCISGEVTEFELTKEEIDAIASAPADYSEQKNIIQNQLKSIDEQKIRPSSDIVEALAAGKEAPEYSVNKLQTLEAQAATLRAQLAALNA
jgi:chromosome segregation ATPase